MWLKKKQKTCCLSSARAIMSQFGTHKLDNATLDFVVFLLICFELPYSDCTRKQWSDILFFFCFFNYQSEA
jgi:hypothetical protein